MPEVEKPSEEVGTPEPPKEKTLDEIKAELAADFDKKYKAEIAGLNRANAQAKKELDEIKSANMSAEEKAKKYLEDAETAKKEAEQYQRSLIITKGLTDAGLPLDFAKRVSGSNADEIAADITAFKSYLDGEVKKLVAAEVNAKLAGESPKGATGATPKTITMADFAKLDGKAQNAFVTGGGQIKE